VKRLVVCLSLLVAATSCVGPARSFAVYESRAADSASEAVSAVETVRAGIHDALGNDAFSPYVSALMNDAEEAATTAQGHFAGIQPPDGASDRLREELLPLLQRSSTVVGRARIAARRGDVAELAALQNPLGQVSGDLSSFIERHQP
jgi:hypothetical protein